MRGSCYCDIELGNHIEKTRALEFYKSRSLHELDDQVLSQRERGGLSKPGFITERRGEKGEYFVWKYSSLNDKSVTRTVMSSDNTLTKNCSVPSMYP